MKILSVQPGSMAERAGLSPGDEILDINGGIARDEIDLMYYGSEEHVRYTVRRGVTDFTVNFEGAGDPGIEFEPMRYMSCKNRCVFCFVDQNPPGMRTPVYFKDEDFRLSFLHGSYVTLTALNESHLRRIEEQRLSPLYVSVHVTDPAVRKTLLGIYRDDHLLEKIDRLIGAGIILHTQVVVCPGMNDCDVLSRTVGDLSLRFPGIASIAVVPVGLTRHRQGLVPLQPVGRECALETIELVDNLREECLSNNGVGFVYCADEWYIKAGCEVPGTGYYDDFPQIENGVGMVRDFLEAASSLGRRLRRKRVRKGRYILVTGVSMSASIEEFSHRLNRIPGFDVRAVTVRNRFYGDTVTVSGLLTGGDILDALKGTVRGETVVLPPNCLNDDGVFLDDVSPQYLAEKLGVEVKQGTCDPVEVFL